MASGLETFLYDEQGATKHLKVATVALQCDAEPSVNRARIVAMTEAIVDAHPDVELVVFGEVILCWYTPKRREYHRGTAESIPGETTRTMARLAAEHGIYISLGLSESRDGRLYNAQLLLNPAGEIQAVHRKRYPKSDTFSRGPVPVTVTEIKGIKTGMLICSDAASPRTMWELMKKRLELIILSLADDSDEGLFMAKFNARMYDAWLVTANRYGDEDGHFWDGHLMISDPLGRLRVTTNGREQYQVYDLGFASSPSWPKWLVRSAMVKAPVILHVLRNWKRARSYL
jgi:predicted amidohydrolase